MMNSQLPTTGNRQLTNVNYLLPSVLCPLMRLQIKVRPKGLHSFAFYILIFAFYLTSYELRSNNYCKLATGDRQLYSTTIEGPLQIGPFLCKTKPMLK